MIQYIIVGIILAVTLAFALRRIVRSVKGESDCNCCSHCEHCHKQPTDHCHDCNHSCRNK